MRISHPILCTDTAQDILDGAEQCLFGEIVLRFNPFTFENTPESFCQIQMRRIWRKIEYVESSVLPFLKPFFDFFALMYGRIVKHKDGKFFKSQGKFIHIFYEFFAVDILGGGKAMIPVVPANHAEDVKPTALLCLYGDFLIRKLPAVRHITARADMGLVSEEKVYMPANFQFVKFLQSLYCRFEELRRGFSLGRKSYTLISCAKTSKKRLSVERDTVMPVSFSKAALADFRLSRFSETALRTAFSCSSLLSIGLCLWTLSISNALIPPFLNACCHKYTETWEQPRISAISLFVLPVDFNKIPWQRRLKRGNFPYFWPCSKAVLSVSERFIISACLIVYICVFRFHIYRLKNKPIV